eukprot:Gb_13520 [translate_table: standard]
MFLNPNGGSGFMSQLPGKNRQLSTELPGPEVPLEGTEVERPRPFHFQNLCQCSMQSFEISIVQHLCIFECGGKLMHWDPVNSRLLTMQRNFKWQFSESAVTDSRLAAEIVGLQSPWQQSKQSSLRRGECDKSFSKDLSVNCTSQSSQKGRRWRSGCGSRFFQKEGSNIMQRCISNPMAYILVGESPRIMLRARAKAKAKALSVQVKALKIARVEKENIGNDIFNCCFGVRSATIVAQ